MILIRPAWTRRLAKCGLIIALVSMAACSNDETGGGEAGDIGPVVVATTTILGEVVGEVLQADGTVNTLMPIGTDAHEFRLSSGQAASLRTAPLVVAIGLGLEQGMADALASAKAEGANVVEVGPQLDPQPLVYAEDGEEHTDRDAPDGEAAALDPHVWMDPLRMADAAERIGEAIAAVDDSQDDSVWMERASAYAERLRALDADLQALYGRIPADRRVLVTNHGAFGYLAGRYGFEILGTVVPGGSTLAEPSSEELAHLVEVLEESGARAIFTESSSPDALARAVAAELNRPIEVVELYTESLGPPGSGADTYVGMMETNARRIVDALTETGSSS